MPSAGDSLQQEACARESGRGREEAFVEFEGGELVAVGGEDAVRVRCGEPLGGKKLGFNEGELSVEGAGDAAGRKRKRWGGK